MIIILTTYGCGDLDFINPKSQTTGDNEKNHNNHRDDDPDCDISPYPKFSYDDCGEVEEIRKTVYQIQKEGSINDEIVEKCSGQDCIVICHLDANRYFRKLSSISIDANKLQDHIINHCDTEGSCKEQYELTTGASLKSRKQFYNKTLYHLSAGFKFKPEASTEASCLSIRKIIFQG
jgi:hypothetical protein